MFVVSEIHLTSDSFQQQSQYTILRIRYNLHLKRQQPRHKNAFYGLIRSGFWVWCMFCETGRDENCAFLLKHPHLEHNHQMQLRCPRGEIVLSHQTSDWTVMLHPDQHRSRDPKINISILSKNVLTNYDVNNNKRLINFIVSSIFYRHIGVVSLIKIP